MYVCQKHYGCVVVEEGDSCSICQDQKNGDAEIDQLIKENKRLRRENYDKF